MTKAVERGYVTLPSGRQMHYRRLGAGSPLIMLHASPQSSEALIPAAQYFSKVSTCIMLDTPGYGLSDKLNTKSPTISDYAKSVIEAADALGLSKFCLYGAATGSQIAIEVGKLYPERLGLLMLDANGHVSDADRNKLLDGYFPSVTPQYGGGHLLTYWEMCRSLFVAFPWTSGKVSDSFNIPPPPPPVLQKIMLRYLQAGEDYSLAYSTAFHIENRDHMNGLDVPTTMTRWVGSPVLSIADDLIALGLPDCVRILEAGPEIAERYNIQSKVLAEALEKLDIPPMGKIAVSMAACDKLTRHLIGDADEYIHTQQVQTKSGRPIICLHDACRSSQQFVSYIEPIVGKRPLVLVDLPGHGESIKFNNSAEVSLENMALTTASALKADGYEDIDIIGIGLGGAVGAWLSRHMEVQHLYIVEGAYPSPLETPRKYKMRDVDLTPDPNGLHLIRAWNWIRNKELYKLNTSEEKPIRCTQDANLKPASIHQKTVELLMTGEHHAAIENITVNIDWQCLLDNTSIAVSHIDLENITESFETINKN